MPRINLERSEGIKSKPDIKADPNYVRLIQLEHSYKQLGITLEAFQYGEDIFLDVGEGIIIEVTHRQQNLDQQPNEFEVLVVKRLQDLSFAKKFFEGPRRFAAGESNLYAALHLAMRTEFQIEDWGNGSGWYADGYFKFLTITGTEQKIPVFELNYTDI